MLNIVPIVLVDSFSVQQQLMQIVDILLDNVGNIFKLSQFMPVMFSEHAFRADNGMADLAEVLNLLILMLETKDLASYLIRYGPTHPIVNVVIVICSVLLLVVIRVSSCTNTTLLNVRWWSIL